MISLFRDIAELFRDPIRGVAVLPDEEDVTLLHALILGNLDTPYEGGFFYFTVRWVMILGNLDTPYEGGFFYFTVRWVKIIFIILLYRCIDKIAWDIFSITLYYLNYVCISSLKNHVLNKFVFSVSFWWR